MSKTYAFSDLHGNYNLWKEIQNYLKENDKAYCLGDCCDRGPNGVKIMQEVLKDKRITYLLGNHEIMFLDTKDTKLKSLTKQEKEDLKYNGTIETIRQYFELTEEEQIELTNQLKNLPCYAEYINKNNQKVFLSHAGGNPDYLEFADMTYLTWNRTHIGVSSWKYYQKRFPNLYIIHGHTPVQVITGKYQKAEVLFYCGNHKIDIDLCTYTSGKAALIDLDTFEVIYFEDKENKIEKIQN